MGEPPMVSRIVITDTVAVASMGDGWADPVQVAAEFLTSWEAEEEKEDLDDE
jgi:hypothetical protein